MEELRLEELHCSALPTELWTKIIDQLDAILLCKDDLIQTRQDRLIARRSVLDLSLLNMNLRMLCLPILFRDLRVDLRNIQVMFSQNYRMARPVYLFFESKPELAQLARTLKVSNFTSSRSESSWYEPDLIRLIDLLPKLQGCSLDCLATQTLWQSLMARPALKFLQLRDCTFVPTRHGDLLPSPHRSAQLEYLMLRECHPSLWQMLEETWIQDSLKSLSIVRPFAPFDGNRWFNYKLWRSLETLSISLADWHVLSIVFGTTSKFRMETADAALSLRQLNLDCGSLRLTDLHFILDALQGCSIRDFSLLSSPDDEWVMGQGGHALFARVAQAMPQLERLLIFRGEGYELVPWIADLRGYSQALAPLNKLQALCLNHSNGYHGPGTSSDAYALASLVPSLRRVVFAGKVNEAVSASFRLLRDNDGVIQGVTEQDHAYSAASQLPFCW